MNDGGTGGEGEIELRSRDTKVASADANRSLRGFRGEVPWRNCARCTSRPRGPLSWSRPGSTGAWRLLDVLPNVELGVGGGPLPSANVPAEPGECVPAGSVPQMLWVGGEE